jgi:hypothetical protein
VIATIKSAKTDKIKKKIKDVPAEIQTVKKTIVIVSDRAKGVQKNANAKNVKIKNNYYLELENVYIYHELNIYG